MISFFEPKILRANARRLISCARGGAPVGEWDRRDYFRALDLFQKTVFIRPQDPRTRCYVFPGDGGHGDRIVRLFETDLSLDAGAAFDARERELAAARLEAAFALLAKDLGAAYAPVELLIGTVAVVKKPLFGSCPAALGAIVAGPRDYLPVEELAALLLHEAVHQSIFLADMIEPLFRLAPRDAPEILNPILRKKRPLDFAYHAAFVSRAVAQYYLMHQRTMEAASFLAPLHHTLRELNEASDALTTSGKLHLEALGSAVIGAEWVERVLGAHSEHELEEYRASAPQSLTAHG